MKICRRFGATNSWFPVLIIQDGDEFWRLSVDHEPPLPGMALFVSGPVSEAPSSRAEASECFLSFGLVKIAERDYSPDRRSDIVDETAFIRDVYRAIQRRRMRDVIDEGRKTEGL